MDGYACIASNEQVLVGKWFVRIGDRFVQSMLEIQSMLKNQFTCTPAEPQPKTLALSHNLHMHNSSNPIS